MTWWAIQNVYTLKFLTLVWPVQTTEDRTRALAWLSEDAAKNEITRLDDPDAWIAVEE